MRKWQGICQKMSSKFLHCVCSHFYSRKIVKYVEFCCTRLRPKNEMTFLKNLAFTYKESTVVWIANI